MTDNGTTKPSITIDDLEALAAQIESEASAERERLHRLIRALARILVIREPERFKPQALEYSDEDGSYDNYDGNYPPDIVYKDHRGPQLMMVRGNNTTEIATSGGFYHDWRLETTDPGLYVSLSGDLYGCTQTGTGKFAPFAARPGNCNVMCRLSWDTLDLDDISMERLREAETTLRNLVAPFLAAVS